MLSPYIHWKWPRQRLHACPVWAPRAWAFAPLAIGLLDLLVQPMVPWYLLHDNVCACPLHIKSSDWNSPAHLRSPKAIWKTIPMHICPLCQEERCCLHIAGCKTLNEMPNPCRRQLQTPPNCETVGIYLLVSTQIGGSGNRELCFLISLINQNLGLISKHRGVTIQNYGSTIWQSSMTGYLEYQTHIIEYIVIYIYIYVIISS